MPEEALLALDALHEAVVTNTLADRKLHEAPALTATVLDDSDEPVRLSVGELAATPMRPQEVGAFILQSHGVAQLDAVELLTHRYQHIAIYSLSNLTKILAGIKHQLPNKMREGRTLVEIMQASHELHRPSYVQRRDEILSVYGDFEYDLRPTKPITDWHIEAIQGYINGLSIKAIAGEYKVSSRAVIHAFTRALERHEDAEDKPYWYSDLARLREQATHGGRRISSESASDDSLIGTQWEEIARLYASGMTYKGLAERYGYSTAAVRNKVGRLADQLTMLPADERPDYYSRLIKSRQRHANKRKPRKRVGERS